MAASKHSLIDAPLRIRHVTVVSWQRAQRRTVGARTSTILGSECSVQEVKSSTVFVILLAQQIFQRMAGVGAPEGLFF